MEEKSLQIPLPLAELLHVALGSLTSVLADEDHSWVELMERVVKAYQQGRDDYLYEMHGSRVVASTDLVTLHVAETLAMWSVQLADEADHFDEWKKELDDK